MKETIKGISGIAWLLAIGPIVVFGLFDWLKETSYWFALVVSVGIYFAVLYLLVYWSEK